MEKTKRENSNFLHLAFIFPSFFYDMYNSKLYGVREYYTCQMTSLLSGIFLFWFGVAYEL